MKSGFEAGKRRAICIAALSSIALILGLALMLAAVRDYHERAQTPSIDAAGYGGDSTTLSVQVSEPLRAGSHAGYEEAAGVEERHSIGEETADARQPEAPCPAADAGASGSLAQEPVTEGVRQNIGRDLSNDTTAALENGGASMGEGRAEESEPAIMENDASKDKWQAEDEKTQEQPESHKGSP